ncbi:hypothetical protein MMC25_005134 [Agyrium rufum]|nr:hypothetical protein [Agyrium rufum]
MEVRLSHKRRFFEELDALDDIDDSNAVSDGEVSAFLKTSSMSEMPRTTSRSTRAKTDSHIHVPSDTMVSKPVMVPPLSMKPPSKYALDVKAAEEVQITAPVMSAVKAPPAASIDPRPESRRKRKRGKASRQLPEEDQTFRNLTFYFVPNNDVAAARKFRIQKAIEYGATWTKPWVSGTTHIIADKELSYADVLTHLNVSSIPANIVLVNEIYPSDCISFRFLLPPENPKYKLFGQTTEVAGTPVAPVPDSSNDSSLVLKPDARHPVQTPSRTEGSHEVGISRVIDTIAKERTLHEQREKRHWQDRDSPQGSLEEAIEQVKAFQDINLESDEEAAKDENPAQQNEEAESDDDTISSNSETKTKHSNRPKLATLSADIPSWQKSFACMRNASMTTTSANPNARTIEILQKMATYYDQTQDHWRTRAYRQAISELRRQTKPIFSREEAIKLRNVGSRLADKIEEVALTERLRCLDNAILDPFGQVLKLFTGIYGVGLAQANAWISKGYQTLDDLRSKAKLTMNQEIGIKHYADFQARIPRSEVEKLGSIVRKVVAQVDPGIEVTIGGSYRRGANESGDVDFILVSPEMMKFETLRNHLHESIIPKLYAINILKCTFASSGPASSTHSSGTKWHGACALPASMAITSTVAAKPKSPMWRRIDFLLVPWEERGAAMIYFTGNDIFNRSIRLLAQKKGMRLNQMGLYKDVAGETKRRMGEGGTGGDLVEGRNERRIFEVLGVEWREPHERCC